MKLSWFALLVASVSFVTQSVSAQTNTNDASAERPANATPWETALFLRTTAARNGQFFNYTEAAVDNGRWVVLDGGWLNFGQAGYAEVFVGAGRIHSIGKRGTLIEELYFDRSYGYLSDHASYLQTYVSAEYQFGKGWSADTNLLPYLPLNKKGTFQLVVDRASLRKRLNDRLQVSAGYSAFKFGNTPLVNKEFGSLILLTKSRGSFETMLIHFPGLPGGFGAQFRYVLTLKKR
jgi:hypothetical protein